MIEIKGVHGSILSSSYYNYTSISDFSSWDWSFTSNVNAASSVNELDEDTSTESTLPTVSELKKLIKSIKQLEK